MSEESPNLLAPNLGQAPCLYCSTTSGPFISRENVLPESLGNNRSVKEGEILLPRGVVCDTCNHGVLSQLDQALLEFDAVSMVRVFEGVRTKKGKWVTAEMGNVTLRRENENDIYVEPRDGGDATELIPDGFNLTVQGRKRLTPYRIRNLTRALFKITLGLIYVDHGPTALAARFDEMRRMIMGDKFTGYLIMGREAIPARQVRFRYDFVRMPPHPGDTVWTEASIYGVRLYTDVDIRDVSAVAPLSRRQHPAVLDPSVVV